MTEDTIETIAVGLCFALYIVFGWYFKRPLVAFLSSAMVTAMLVVWYVATKHYLEMGGIIHILCGGAWGLAFCYLFKWIRRRRTAK